MIPWAPPMKNRVAGGSHHYITWREMNGLPQAGNSGTQTYEQKDEHVQDVDVATAIQIEEAHTCYQPECDDDLNDTATLIAGGTVNDTQNTFADRYTKKEDEKKDGDQAGDEAADYADEQGDEGSFDDSEPIDLVVYGPTSASAVRAELAHGTKERAPNADRAVTLDAVQPSLNSGMAIAKFLGRR
ncbi:MAG: hypothetical protein NVSMB42_03260 [Herpetosiphon sp.]